MVEDVKRDLPKPDPRKTNQVTQIHLGWLGLVRKILSPSPEPFAEGVSALSQITGGPH